MNELYLWKKAKEADLDKVKEELADVFAYALLLVNHYNLDAESIVNAKIDKNGKKYLVDKAFSLCDGYCVRQNQICQCGWAEF